MSLRFRLIGLVCAILLVSLALGITIAYSNAKRSVRHEMQAALALGRQTIENALDQLAADRDPTRELDNLVASFNGNRHLRVKLVGASPVSAGPQADRAALGGMPDWFIRLIGIIPQQLRIPVRTAAEGGRTLVIETDPYNETVEVWNEFADGLVAPTVFCGLTIVLIYVFIGRLLRPLDRLTGALEQVADGCYRTQLRGRLPPELARLHDSFNRMAARVAAADADNRRLNEQLLSLREQERADLSRDLHDEVSPFLFAINIDCAAASRFIAQGRPTQAQEHVACIGDAVRHLQRQVKQLLARLRPMGLDEFSLQETVENIVAFWRRRRPEIRFDVRIAAHEPLPDPLGATICRIVQEALSNALRHAEPRVVGVSIDIERSNSDEGDVIRVEIADDGRGMEEPSRIGYGLLGLGERVRTIGGRLNFANRRDGGFAVRAILPCAPPTAEVVPAMPAVTP